MSGNRQLVATLGIVAAVLLFWLVNPWWRPDSIGDGVKVIVTIAFWVLFLAVVVLMFQERNDAGATEVQVEGPAFTRYLFSNTQAGWFWLPIRLFLAFSWLEAGWGKFTGAGWLDGGAALKGYWTAAVALPDQGRPPIAYEWYRDFLNLLLQNNAYTWFAWLIVFGELLVGLGLLFGVLTGFAAFFGATMNMSYLLAGSASTNPVLFAMAIGLILAWKVAGYIGLDRYLLPLVGVPWRAEVQTAAPVSTPTTT
ncbi:MAG TPA: DoxX family membrane protein [Candidatus Limnocylindrales bacterium]|jgi:thiosulfate dehydrogenase [quinone] large subunit